MQTELSTPNTRREKEVWQACDDLWAQSASPRHLTGDNIRDQLVKLGFKRGSPNEIYRYRSTWKESRGISDVSENAEGETKASDPISRAVSLVYDQIRSQASETIDKLTEDYEMQLKAALLEAQTLSEQLRIRETELNALRKELSEAALELQGLQAHLTEQKREHALLNERLRGARDQHEAVTAEHKALIVELKAFHEREIDLWRNQHTQLQRTLTEQKEAAQIQAERQGAIFSDELLKLKTQLRQTQEENMRAEAKLEAFDAAAARQDAQFEAFQTLFEIQRRNAQFGQRKIERLLQRKSGPPRSNPRSRRG